MIFLAITDYVLFPKKKAYKSNHITLDQVTHEQDLKDFSYTFIELPKFNKTIAVAKKTIEDSWIYFFKHGQETNEPIADLLKLPHIQQAYEIVKSFNWSEAELNYYEREEMKIMDEKGMVIAAKKEGHEEGREEAKLEERQKAKKEKLAIARNLKKIGLSLDQIMQNTGLQKSDIEKL